MASELCVLDYHTVARDVKLCLHSWHMADALIYSHLSHFCRTEQLRFKDLAQWPNSDSLVALGLEPTTFPSVAQHLFHYVDGTTTLLHLM